MAHTECKWRIQTPFFQYQANFRFSFALWYAVLRWCIQTPQWLSDSVVVKLMCDMSLGLCSRQSLQPGEPIKHVVLSATCVSDGWLFHLADIVLWLAKRPFTHVFGGSEKTNMPVVVGARGEHSTHSLWVFSTHSYMSGTFSPHVFCTCDTLILVVCVRWRDPFLFVYQSVCLFISPLPQTNLLGLSVSTGTLTSYQLHTISSRRTTVVNSLEAMANRLALQTEPKRRIPINYSFPLQNVMWNRYSDTLSINNTESIRPPKTPSTGTSQQY